MPAASIANVLRLRDSGLSPTFFTSGAAPGFVNGCSVNFKQRSGWNSRPGATKHVRRLFPTTYWQPWERIVTSYELSRCARSYAERNSVSARVVLGQ